MSKLLKNCELKERAGSENTGRTPNGWRLKQSWPCLTRKHSLDAALEETGDGEEDEDVAEGESDVIRGLGEVMKCEEISSSRGKCGQP